jgi:Tfp pilus assembly protein PilV
MNVMLGNREMQIQPAKSHRNGTAPGRGHPLSRKAQEAFTLAEVIIAVFVLAVMTLSLYAGFTTGFMIVDSAREDLRATQILMQKAEAIRLCTWSSLANCPITFVERYDPTGYSGGSSAGGTLYRGTLTTNVPSSIRGSAAYKTNMCLVNLTIAWTNYNGRQFCAHSRSMQTLVARYGLQNYIWGTGP